MSRPLPWGLWLAVAGFFLFLALANPGQVNGGTLVVILLAGLLTSTLPTIAPREGG